MANINKVLIQKYFKRQKKSFPDDLKIGVLKDYAIFRGKHLGWSLFLITLQV